MSYQVLARKWRPLTFQSMVGQEMILRMLTNALTQQRLHHAYLFTGTRGVGKTTLARILAACFNCETGITATPCRSCAACQAIQAGKFLDLYEVDAASRTKVEDTRELLENVIYPPVQGRYKIYLIDEVHMLSTHSFNALLKTLEEPPPQVKFLLATTEPKRLPITILSRCLQFNLKRITPQKIADHLQYVCDNEKIAYEKTALTSLAKAAEGSMRDALSLLDQAIAFGNGQVQQSDVNTMLGTISHDKIHPLLNAIIAQNAKQLFAIIQELADQGSDFEQVLEELITCLHQIALQQIVTEMPVNEEAIIHFAKQITPSDLQLYYQIALIARRDLALTSTPQQGFEMAMLRMLAFAPDVAKPALSATPLAKKEPPAPIAAPPVPSSSLPEWRHLLGKLELTGMAYALASNCTLTKIEENKVELALATHHQPMLNAKLKERIAEALARYLKHPIELEINITSEPVYTPQKQQQDEQTERLKTVTTQIMQEPKIKNLIDMYDATVEISLL